MPETNPALTKPEPIKPALSILTAVCGRIELYRKHLAALAAQPAAKNCQLVLAAWGDAAEHEQLFRQQAAAFNRAAMLFLNDPPVWPLPRAYNAALWTAVSDNVLILGTDIVVPDTFLASALALAETGGAWVFRVTNSDGEEYVCPARKLALPFAMLLPRAALIHAGGWDEAFCNGLSFEDADLVLRLIASGVRFHWDMTQRCLHQAHGTYGADARPKLKSINAAIWRGRTHGVQVPLWPAVHHGRPPADDGIAEQDALAAALIAARYPIIGSFAPLSAGEARLRRGEAPLSGLSDLSDRSDPSDRKEGINAAG